MKLFVEKYGEKYRLLKMPYRFGTSKERMFNNSEDESTPSEREQSEKLDNNISRARSRILELGYSNKWEYFCTLTLDGAKRDRYDLNGFVRALGKWIGHYNRKFSCKLKYLLIPEQHKDGAYHMHGLLSGVSSDSLVKNEYNFLDIPFYRERFGFISLDPIRDENKTVSYITKYITKDAAKTSVAAGNHLFYASRGLEGKQRIAAFDVPENFKMDFENEYCGITWLRPEQNIEDIVLDIIKQEGEFFGQRNINDGR